MAANITIVKKPVSPILNEDGDLHPDWHTALGKVFDAISGPLPLRQFSLATLPDAGKHLGHTVYVTDATGGSVPVHSNGTNWLRFSNNAIVS